MRTVQRARATGQLASNGQAEKTVDQKVAKHVEVLRGGTGQHHVWSFAWLITRYRVINGATSFEVTHDRRYDGN